MPHHTLSERRAYLVQQHTVLVTNTHQPHTAEQTAFKWWHTAFSLHTAVPFPIATLPNMASSAAATNTAKQTRQPRTASPGRAATGCPESMPGKSVCVAASCATAGRPPRVRLSASAATCICPPCPCGDASTRWIASPVSWAMKAGSGPGALVCAGAGLAVAGSTLSVRAAGAVAGAGAAGAAAGAGATRAVAGDGATRAVAGAGATRAATGAGATGSVAGAGATRATGAATAPR